MKLPYLQIGLGLALGAGMAMAVAFIFGSRGIWLALGMAIGVVIGVLVARRPTKNLYRSQTDLWIEKQ